MAQAEPGGSNRAGRAHRFALHLPVWYLIPGQVAWRSGVTENISTSGAAFRTDEPLIPATPIRVIIPLPATSRAPAGCLTGRGRVVRSILLPAQPEVLAFAVSVDRYRLDRHGRALKTIRQE